MDKSKFSSTVIIALIIGLVAGFALGAYLYGDRGSAETGALQTDGWPEGGDIELSGETSLATSGGQAAATPSRPAAAAVALVVDDQIAGPSVIVRDATLAAESWLAVRDYKAGQPGNILGARRLPAGTHPAELITLLRTTAAGQSYAVVIYEDDGDGQFDHKKDSLLARDGQPLIVPFRAI